MLCYSPFSVNDSVIASYCLSPTSSFVLSTIFESNNSEFAGAGVWRTGTGTGTGTTEGVAAIWIELGWNEASTVFSTYNI